MGYLRGRGGVRSAKSKTAQRDQSSRTELSDKACHPTKSILSVTHVRRGGVVHGSSWREYSITH